MSTSVSEWNATHLPDHLMQPLGAGRGGGGRGGGRASVDAATEISVVDPLLCILHMHSVASSAGLFKTYSL